MAGRTTGRAAPVRACLGELSDTAGPEPENPRCSPWHGPDADGDGEVCRGSQGVRRGIAGVPAGFAVVSALVCGHGSRRTDDGGAGALPVHHWPIPIVRRTAG